MRRCRRCLVVKPVEQFHRFRSGHQAWCKDCRRIYDRAYHERTRDVRLRQKREWADALYAWYHELKSHPCADCGQRFHHAAMTFDHLPGVEKVDEVSNLVRRRRKRAAILEVEKCELVCANCHAVRSYERRRGVAQPGQSAAFGTQRIAGSNPAAPIHPTVYACSRAKSAK
jgi:hypothetical protein